MALAVLYIFTVFYDVLDKECKVESPFRASSEAKQVNQITLSEDARLATWVSGVYQTRQKVQKQVLWKQAKAWEGTGRVSEGHLALPVDPNNGSEISGPLGLSQLEDAFSRDLIVSLNPT